MKNLMFIIMLFGGPLAFADDVYTIQEYGKLSFVNGSEGYYGVGTRYGNITYFYDSYNQYSVVFHYGEIDFDTKYGHNLSDTIVYKPVSDDKALKAYIDWLYGPTDPKH